MASDFQRFRQAFMTARQVLGAMLTLMQAALSNWLQGSHLNDTPLLATPVLVHESNNLGRSRT